MTLREHLKDLDKNKDISILVQLEKKIREIYQFDDEFKRLLLDTQQFLLDERDNHDEMTKPYGRFEFLVDLINEIIY